MLAVTRERLLEHLLELSALTDRYANGDPALVSAAIAWFAACEATLQQLRSPLAGLLASERAEIFASRDGYREATAAAIHPRKAPRVAASRALAHAEAELRAVIVGIDTRFGGFREKMAQLLAVASASQSIPLPGGMPRDQWLAGVWQILRQSAEGRSMAAYLSSALGPSDLWFVLGETLDNLLGAGGP